MNGRTVLAVAWPSLAVMLVGLAFAWGTEGVWAVSILGMLGVPLLGIVTIGAMVTDKPDRPENPLGLRDVGQYGLSARGAHKIEGD